MPWLKVSKKKNRRIVTYEADGKEEKFAADYVFVMVGRRPNTDEFGLEQAGVKLDERGFVKVDKQCRTNVPNIYAIGDIVPGPQLAHKASYEGKIAAEAISGHLEKLIISVFRLLSSANLNWLLLVILKNRLKKKVLKLQSVNSRMQHWPFTWFE